MVRLASSKYVTLIALPRLQVSFDLRNAIITLSLDVFHESLLHEICHADYGLDVREGKVSAGLSLDPRGRKQLCDGITSSDGSPLKH